MDLDRFHTLSQSFDTRWQKVNVYVPGGKCVEGSDTTKVNTVKLMRFTL